MQLLLDIVSWALLGGGAFFIIAGAIGLLRLPDVFARMHGAGIVDTLGAGLFIAGLMIQGGFTLTSVKLLLMFVFIMFASPTSSYALANAALSQGVEPGGTKKRDDADENNREKAPSNP